MHDYIFAGSAWVVITLLQIRRDLFILHTVGSLSGTGWLILTNFPMTGHDAKVCMQFMMEEHHCACVRAELT